MKIIQAFAGRSAARLAACALFMLILASGQASALEVTGSFTGWWGQPDHENQGLIVSVSRRLNGENTAVIYWATYDDEGNPSWFFAQGGIQGNTIQADLYQFDGVTFLQRDDPDNNPGEIVGEISVQFSDCREGDVSFDTPDVIVGTGGFRVARITNQPGTHCSGGISDNTPPTSLPEEFRVQLIPTGAIGGASGKADFESRPGRTDFSVEIEDVPAGAYSLHVGGVPRGSISVIDTANGPEGETEFRSPAEPGKQLLDFDPRGQIIEVLQGSTVVLESIAPDSGDIPGSDQGNPPPFGNSEIEVSLVNAGAFPAGSGDAEFEQESNRVDFDVEIEDVPTGSYTLAVGGTERGTIQVVNTASGPEGELEFRFPAEPGKLPLDFDPRGQLIEVSNASGLVFSVDFPATGGDDDDDSGDDDSGDDDSGGDDGSGGDDDSGGGDDGSGGDDDSGGGDDNSDPGEIEVSLNNAGVFPAASGDARYRADDDGDLDFDVEIEDLPTGGYDLFVGGVQRGTIEVEPTGDGNEGEIEFGSPADPDELPLDFDPRGQLIEIFDGSTLIFSVDFPS
ncbi:MAG: hypothetical protein WDZ60_03330 [Wenzhouxiangellaceae bacterium]